MELPQPETQLSFPQGFLLGAAAAAHQVEGNNINSDWWYWEEQGKFPKSGQACDHYHRYDEDFGLAQQIGLNAMRISIEWARIEPSPGKWNAEAIEHYKKVLQSMKAHGLTRMVTLWHWTLPKWLADRGGFETHEGVEAFARYSWFVAQNLGTEVDLWVTINEPEIYVNASYVRGSHPPFEKSWLVTRRVMENLINAHNAAFKAIKETLGPTAQVGIAKNNSYFEPFRKNNLFDRLVVYLTRKITNEYFLQKIQHHLDFIGLNQYFHQVLKFDLLHCYREMNENFTSGQLQLNDALDRSDMGWKLFPEGIYHALKELQYFGKPVYITENGLADAQDNRRPKFLAETFSWLRRAIDEGVKLQGYFYWSLTDNYEWEHGFGPRFGLIEMDYTTLARKIRPSAEIFKQIKIV